jgi:hypothetical protein
MSPLSEVDAYYIRGLLPITMDQANLHARLRHSSNRQGSIMLRQMKPAGDDSASRGAGQTTKHRR